MKKTTTSFVLLVLFNLFMSNVNAQTLVLDIYPGEESSVPKKFTALGTDLYFEANDGTNGKELWKYDGTTPSIVQDINPGAGNSSPFELTVLGACRT